VPLLDFFAHALTVPLVMLLAATWARGRGWLRPYTAPIVSWEVMLYTIAKWPWVLFGVAHSLAGKATGRRFGFKVTPKGIDAATPLALKVVLPYLLISGGSTLTAVLTSRAGAASGYYYFCLVNAVLYTVVAAAIVALHLREASKISLREAWRLAPGATLATTLSGVGAAVGLAFRGRDVAYTLLPRHDWNKLGSILHKAFRVVVPSDSIGTTTGLVLAAGAAMVVGSLWHASSIRRPGAARRPTAAWVSIHTVLVGIAGCTGNVFVALVAVGDTRVTVWSVDIAPTFGAVAALATLAAIRVGRRVDHTEAPDNQGARRLEASPGPHMSVDDPLDLVRLVDTLPSEVAIDWLDDDERSGFGLTATDRNLGPLLTLAQLPDGAAEPARTPETSRAHAMLYDRLVAAGWEPYSRDAAWYSHRFRRSDT
jgi:hypothetical protein